MRIRLISSHLSILFLRRHRHPSFLLYIFFDLFYVAISCVVFMWINRSILFESDAAWLIGFVGSKRNWRTMWCWPLASSNRKMKWNSELEMDKVTGERRKNNKCVCVFFSVEYVEMSTCFRWRQTEPNDSRWRFSKNQRKLHVFLLNLSTKRDSSTIRYVPKMCALVESFLAQSFRLCICSFDYIELQSHTRY